ncbi:hypothetical protein AGMMS49938_12670 [Fibrobacterales bacterium]|nr:hypothetical protein AGMMS49938_12670 [Fibrobacterales bacterium]
MFHYKANLSDCKKVVLFLPCEQENLFVFLPLALSLAEKRGQDDFLILTDENNRHILRAIDLENKSIFYNSENLLYGEPVFFELERRIKEQKWEVCLFLQEQTTLPYLYLAKVTDAPYRLGIKQEFPFLNIALQTAEANPTAYDYRNFLYKTFAINSVVAQEHAIHATLKNEKNSGDYAHLSTSNTLLLNLEPPTNGEPWTAEEISTLYKSLQPQFRLIAIADTSERLDNYQKILEDLDMRSSPVLLHSESVFSILRQYPAIITLNSPHTHLFFNLSFVHIIMLNSFGDSFSGFSSSEPTNAKNSNRLLKFARNGNFYSLTDMIKSSLKPTVPPPETTVKKRSATKRQTLL